MNELTRVLNGLTARLPSITFEQLLAMQSPRAEFERHIPAERGRDFWVYSVRDSGIGIDSTTSTLNRDLIVVRASLPQQAEMLAQEGLRDTIAALRKFDANTGLQSTVEVRGAES